MKKNLNKIILFMIIFIFVLVFFEAIAFAGETFNPDAYKSSHTVTMDDGSEIFNIGGDLLKILRNIAAVVSVLTITIIGFRYMVGSVEQKAEYKQTMMPVVIGCILVASLSGILTIIQSVV